jgi:hypothetical protein
MSTKPGPEGKPESITTPVDRGEWLDTLKQQVASLRFGVIQVVVHEGRVVQIERTEKFRLNSKGPLGSL